MVSTRKKKNQQKKQLSQTDETLVDFVIGRSVNVNVWESEILEQQANGSEWVDESLRQIKSQMMILTTKSEERLVVLPWLKNRMHDAILTAIDNKVIPSVKMAVKLITSSTGHRPNCEV